ncbi:MAG: metal-dependent hydrolase, partial [Candidatus Edwardsbacteria bacterium]|nr:metal-dependent hydrolase [Candidatus Edwardsbacteria bacterium]
FLVSWAVAGAAPLERRDRALATLAGIVPDLDAAGLLADLVRPVPDDPHYWYQTYHHVLAHNLAAALMTGILCFLLARRRWTVAGLAFLLFHVHLLCDLLGSGGPDGGIWPVHYLYPFVKDLPVSWSGQWALNAWPNVAITAVAIALTLYLGTTRGYTPIEVISPSADREIVKAIRRWTKR